MALKLANNASSTLAAAISASDTTLSVASGDAGLFPTLAAGDWFPLTIIDSGGNMEVVRVTARSGAALTVTRAQEGTTAKAFASGTRCDLRLTAAAVNSKQDNLGFTPVQQGGGPNQGANKIYVGWSSTVGENMLRVQVDSSDFGITWPINISGNAANATNLGGTSLATLNNAIGAKVAKSGDIMTGPLEIQTDPSLWLHRQNVKRARWVIDANGSLLWQDQGGQNHFYITNVGAIWTQQMGDLNTRIEQRAAAYADDRKNNCVTDSRMAGYTQVQQPPSGGGNWENSAYVITLTNRVASDAYLFGARQPQLYIANRGWFAAFPF